MPAAEMISGTIIGEISSPMIMPRNGMCLRDSPSAAMVPSVVAIRVAKMAMITELRTEVSHEVLEKKSLYQRIE
jgi:hypothetical protein